MTSPGWLVWALKAIGVITIATGATQAVAPGFVMGLLAININAASVHLFRIVGLFMVLFGGLLLHALSSATPQRAALLWVGLQKLGAFAFLGLGVVNGVFSPLAWLVAVFDLLSGLLILAHRRSIRDQ